MTPGRVGLTTLLGITLAAVAVVGSAVPSAAVVVVMTDEELAAGLLVYEDVPGDGWTAVPPDVIEPEPHTQANDIEGGWCDGATDFYAAGELRAAGGAITTVRKVAAPDEPYWFVWESLHSFDAAFGESAVRQAKSFMATMRTAATGCESWVTNGGEITNSISGAIVAFAAVGKQRFAVEITTSGDGVSEVTHAVYVRVGNNVAVIHARILPTDSALLTQIVKQATKKLKQAATAAA